MESAQDFNEKKESGQFYIPYYQIPIDKFFQFGLSVDCVIFGYLDGALKVLLIKRGAEPFKGKWAVPGDLVYPNEDIEIAARRILFDLTALENLYLEQTKVYGQVDRHPIGRVVTVGYYALINIENYDPHASAWADSVYWVDVNDVPKLAFDHNLILSHALKTLRFRVRHRPAGFELLPEKFAIGQLQSLYQALLNEKYDKANFRKRILSMNMLRALKENEINVPHRPGQLYSFDKEKYDQLKSKGFSFEL
jgi:8-oxo-dGTP diphosphatase